MTEIGNHVDVSGHGECIVLDIYREGESGPLGKEKWFLMVFVIKHGCADTVPSKMLRSRNAFRPPLGKPLDEIGDYVEDARFRVWAMLQLRLRYRGNFEVGLTDAVAKLAQFDPEAAKSVPIPVGISAQIKELRERFYQGKSNNTSDLYRAIDEAFSAAMRAAEAAIIGSQKS